MRKSEVVETSDGQGGWIDTDGFSAWEQQCLALAEEIVREHDLRVDQAALFVVAVRLGIDPVKIVEAVVLGLKLYEVNYPEMDF